jgi:DNA repair protein RadC
VTRQADARQVSLLPPDAAALLHLVRENLRLLAELVARYEIGTLAAPAEERVIRSPADVAAYLGSELADLPQEQLRVVLLDTKNHILGVQLVYQGGLNATVVRLADCFREAVARGAAAVIFVHNHPSGDPTPSAEDVRLTHDAGRVADLLGIELVDHLVLARLGHVSFRETGLYPAAPNAASGVDSANRSDRRSSSNSGGVTDG